MRKVNVSSLRCARFFTVDSPYFPPLLSIVPMWFPDINISHSLPFLFNLESLRQLLFISPVKEKTLDVREKNSSDIVSQENCGNLISVSREVFFLMEMAPNLSKGLKAEHASSEISHLKDEAGNDFSFQHSSARSNLPFSHKKRSLIIQVFPGRSWRTTDACTGLVFAVSSRGF